MKTLLVYGFLLMLANFTFSANADVRQVPRDRDATLTIKDVQIIQGAINLLHSESVWDRSRDILCVDARKTKLSLYCALKKSSEKVLGKYDHDSFAMRSVRMSILKQTGSVKLGHSLQDFNTMESTSFDDLISMLKRVKTYLEREVRENTNPGVPDIRGL